MLVRNDLREDFAAFVQVFLKILNLNDRVSLDESLNSKQKFRLKCSNIPFDLFVI